MQISLCTDHFNVNLLGIEALHVAGHMLVSQHDQYAPHLPSKVFKVIKTEQQF